MYNHLEGAACIEVKYLHKQERETVNGIFKILREVYGCSHSLISLQRRFFNHKQHEEEPLLYYSHALMSLMDQIVEADEQAKPKSQKELCDQFCEGVRDHNLGIRLRDKVRLNPHWTIRDVRREAIEWTTQYEGRSYRSSTATVTCINESAATPKQEFGTPPPPDKTKRHPDGRPRCFRCDQMGHIARYCTAAFPKTTFPKGEAAQVKEREPASELSHMHLETKCDTKPDLTDMSALVGKCPVVEVKMGELVVPSLLDTGSMVTT